VNGLDVGLNLACTGSNKEFEEEVLLILEFVRNLGQKLEISFVVGTDGEDREVLGRGVVSLPLPQLAQFLAS
jgi:hypothetical protein